MDVDPGLAAAATRYVQPTTTSHYLVSGGPVIDEDVDMDMDYDEEPAPAATTQTPAISSHNGSSKNSTTNDSIYASRYAHDYGPVNYVGKKQQPYNHSRYSNDSLTSTPLPRDKYGEELKPPSSSAGRLEEQRRNKQQQQHHHPHQQYNHARYSRDGTIWSSAYAPR